MNTVKLDYKQILKDYPLSIQKIEDTLLEMDDIRGGLSRMGVDLTQEKVLTNFVKMMIEYDPRKLYDIFDTLDIAMGIRAIPSELNGQTTSGFIGEVIPYFHSMLSTSRIEAEKLVFLKAFELLEVELRKTVRKKSNEG